MDWNSEAEAILRAAEQRRNIVVNASAGTGKSTLQLEIARRKNERGLMIGFNQDMKLENTRRAKELKIYGPRGLDVRTMHGWGTTFFPNRFRVNPYKVDQWVRNEYRDHDYARKLIHILKQFRGRGFLRMDERSIQRELRRRRLIRVGDDTASYWRANIKPLMRALLALEEERREIDFNDMCRMPVINGWIRGGATDYPTLYVDEIQDLNNDQIKMLELALEGTNTQAIAVGDTKQSIYGFRGARDSMTKVSRVVDGLLLPLDTTFRCRERIARFVNHQIQASEMVAYRDSGTVDKIRVGDDEVDWLAVDEIVGGEINMVISNRNSTLISVWVELLQRGINADLKGSGVIAGLKATISSVPTYNWSEFVRSMRLVAHAGKRTRFYDQHADMANAVLKIIDGLRVGSKHELFAIVEKMKLETSGIKLETVHSSKGREGERVASICDWFDSGDDPVDNLRYVAWTRARDHLLVIKPGAGR